LKQFSPTLAELRGIIANTISSQVKAYDLNKMCVGLGLEEGEDDEAYKSKAKYVERRIADLDKVQMVSLARDVLTKWDAFELRECLRLFLCDNQPKITIVTRQRLFEELNVMPALNGRMAVNDFISVLVPVKALPSIDFLLPVFFGSSSVYTRQDNDLDNLQILERIGVMVASDDLLYEFLELLVHPRVREGKEQSQFVATLNRIIGIDGFALEEVDNLSGVPVFAICCSGKGVKSRPKNLIFASNGPKPDIILSDAVDNDIQVVANAEYVLIYDRPIARSGLAWTELVNWWKSHPEADSKNPERSLYNRLFESLASPPEKYFFRAYYAVFGDQLSDLPALIPQVYLHYDPKIVREFVGKKRLVRQRMDFLLLFPDRIRVVVEIDGKQHYAEDDGRASPKRYAEMVHEDRSLRLRGYELYRFGGNEMPDYSTAKGVVRDFFQVLIKRFQTLK